VFLKISKLNAVVQFVVFSFYESKIEVQKCCLFALTNSLHSPPSAILNRVHLSLASPFASLGSSCRVTSQCKALQPQEVNLLTCHWYLPHADVGKFPTNWCDQLQLNVHVDGFTWTGFPKTQTSTPCASYPMQANFEIPPSDVFQVLRQLDSALNMDMYYPRNAPGLWIHQVNPGWSLYFANPHAPTQVQLSAPNAQTLLDMIAQFRTIFQDQSQFKLIHDEAGGAGHIESCLREFSQCALQRNDNELHAKFVKFLLALSHYYTSSFAK
jgi:hypothetical protein